MTADKDGVLPADNDLREVLVRLSAAIADADILSWAGAACPDVIKGMKVKTAAIDAARKNLHWRIRAEAGIDESARELLSQIGLQRSFLCVLSEMAIEFCFEPLMAYFGEQAFLAGLLVDAREGVRQRATDHLEKRGNRPFSPPDPDRARDLARIIAPFLEHASAIIQRAEEELTASRKAETIIDPAALIELKHAFGMEKARANALDVLIKKKERENEALRASKDELQKSVSLIREEAKELRRENVKLKGWIKDLEEAAIEAEKTMDEEVERRTLKALASRLRTNLASSGEAVTGDDAPGKSGSGDASISQMMSLIASSPENRTPQIKEWIERGGALKLLQTDAIDQLQDALRIRMTKIYDRNLIEPGKDLSQDPASRLRRSLDAGSSVLVVVDGHNALISELRYRRPDLTDERALRLRFIERVQTVFEPLVQAECRMEFDSPESSQERISPNIMVTYSGGGSHESQRADLHSIIPYIRFSSKSESKKAIFLVTSDRDLAKECVALGATIIPASEFIEIVGC